MDRLLTEEERPNLPPNSVSIGKQYVVTEGALAGTILSPCYCFISVKYPHRKTQDLYCPPLRDVTHWHCCQCDCDFEPGELEQHLINHGGRKIKAQAKQVISANKGG